MDRYSPSTWGECNGLNTLICNLFIMPPNVGLGRSPYWSNKKKKKKKKKRGGGERNCFLPKGICNFRLNGKGPEDQGRTEYKHRGREKKQTCTFWKKPKGHPLWGPNCCEPLRVQMSHCSLFELARVPNRTCRHLICSDSKEVPKVTLRFWHASPCLHSGYTVVLHKILHLSFPVCFHPSLLFSLFFLPPSPPKLCGSLLMLVFI